MNITEMIQGSLMSAAGRWLQTVAGSINAGGGVLVLPAASGQTHRQPSRHVMSPQQLEVMRHLEIMTDPTHPMHGGHMGGFHPGMMGHPGVEHAGGMGHPGGMGHHGGHN